jgi:hypothetical protein
MADDSLVDHNHHDAPGVRVLPLAFDGRLPQPTSRQDVAQADLRSAGYGILTDVMDPDVVRQMRQVVLEEIAREEASDRNRVHRFELDGLDPDDSNRRLKRLP